MISAANMSPVPEKNNGKAGMSMRKRRGWWSEVAVEPIIVRFSTSSSSTERSRCWSFDDESSGACDAGNAGECDAAASPLGDLEGVWVPEAGFDAVLDGAREEIV